MSSRIFAEWNSSESGRRLLYQATKIFKIEQDTVTKDLENLIIYSLTEGKAAYRAHHMLYVDQKFDWSKIPN